MTVMREKKSPWKFKLFNSRKSKFPGTFFLSHYCHKYLLSIQFVVKISIFTKVIDPKYLPKIERLCQQNLADSRGRNRDTGAFACQK